MATRIAAPPTMPPTDPSDETHPALDASIEPLEPRGSGLDKAVFGVTALIAVGFLVWGLVSTASLSSASERGLAWTITNTGWLFVLTASAFVVFVIWLAMSRYGNIPLGRDDEEPEFRTVSWIAMMFSAGMGIGLMFYGVSEPLSHFATPPPGHRRDREPRRRRWPPRCSTGPCTRGRSTPSSAWRSRTAPTARAASQLDQRRLRAAPRPPCARALPAR